MSDSDVDMNSVKSEVVKNRLVSKLKAEARKTPTSAAKVTLMEVFSSNFIYSHVNAKHSGQLSIVNSKN